MPGTYMPLAELVRVLSYPRLQKRHGMDDQKIADFIRSIQQVSIVVEIESRLAPQVSRDANDDAVVATAIISSSLYLRSLDKDILDPAVVQYCKSHDVVVLNDISLLHILRNFRQT